MDPVSVLDFKSLYPANTLDIYYYNSISYSNNGIDPPGYHLTDDEFKKHIESCLQQAYTKITVSTLYGQTGSNEHAIYQRENNNSFLGGG